MIRYSYFLFLGLFFGIGCSTHETPLQIPNEEQLVINLKANALQGDFQIQATGAEWVISNTDSNADNDLSGIVFTLQSENTSPINLKISEGKAYWNNEEVLVVDFQNNDVYRFAITGRSQSAFLKAFPPEFSQQLKGELLGYGFGFQKSPNLGVEVSNWIEGNPNTSVFTASTDRVSPVGNIAPGGDENCPSGGEGATSCSASVGDVSCSISCKNGYYACCSDGPGNSVSCKCVKE
ncbi:MAG TPA: hypothetical protein DCE41_21940 [Cytophagales bacterium]|nr:hypothetical protein [Cytophagales bacterium]HAA19268.1 hypothetical protein [Cytophagales bacterium]HAP58817.1 hypothetical protein [Cytophagales bacterium]